MTAPFQLLRPLTVEERAELTESIRAHGVQVPVIVDEAGTIIDGHHREAIATELGIDCPLDVRRGLSDGDKRDLARTLNSARRQMSREEKRALLADALKAEPQLSDREHARRVGVSDKTAATVRRDLIGNAEIPHSVERLTAAGKPAPGPKPFPVVEAAVERYPELAHFQTKGEGPKAVLIANTLDRLDEPERERRRSNLAATIAADQRGALDPQPDPTEHLHRAADRIFLAANAATRTLRGGLAAIKEALPHEDRITANLWAEEFTDLAGICTELAAVCRPRGLRAVK